MRRLSREGGDEHEADREAAEHDEPAEGALGDRVPLGADDGGGRPEQRIAERGEGAAAALGQPGELRDRQTRHAGDGGQEARPRPHELPGDARGAVGRGDDPRRGQRPADPQQGAEAQAGAAPARRA
jgi:hypothetical protein